MIPLALAKAVGRDVSSYIFPVPPVIAGSRVAFLVGEAEHGGLDLNGDGDALDDVLQIMDVDTGEAVSPVASGQRVTILVGEVDQGGSDLNGDGDTDDQVSIVIHVKSGRAKIEK